MNPPREQAPARDDHRPDDVDCRTPECRPDDVACPMPECRAGTGTADAVGRHVRHYLRAPFLADDARRRYGIDVMRSGVGVVAGGMTSATHWELHDWLTGDPVARGQDGPDGLTAALHGRYHADDLYADVPVPDPATPQLPASLQRALEEWVCDPGTPDEDIAALVDWPVATVREHR